MQDAGCRLRHHRAAENRLVIALGIEESAALQTDHGGRELSGQAWPAALALLFAGTARGTGEDGVHRRGIAARTMRGQRRAHPGELQHRRGNGIASLPQASRLTGLSVKSGQICCVVEMCVVGDHMHRTGSGKGHVLLSARSGDRSP